ncbi:hypothetical protein WN943_004194 [Citrus x changshan-huyou]
MCRFYCDRGDKKTAKGKRFNHSFGNVRICLRLNIFIGQGRVTRRRAEDHPEWRHPPLRQGKTSLMMMRKSISASTSLCSLID